MSTKESTFTSMLVSLVVVTGVAAFSLGFVYKLTEEPIAAAKAEKQMQAIKAVIGKYDNDPLTESYPVCSGGGAQHRYHRRGNCGADHSTDADLTFYPASVQATPSAVAIKTFSDKGYSGRIELMVGLDAEGVIRNIQVVSHSETPGLGSKIATEDFIRQFIGRKMEAEPLKVRKDGGDVDAISGATISSRAFCGAVQDALDAYKETKDGN